MAGFEQISNVLASKKVRYIDFTEMLRETEFRNTYNSGRKVYIYIDLENVVRDLYRGGGTDTSIVDIVKGLSKGESISISSNLFSIAGHYRHYFATKLGIPSEIVFFYSDVESTWAKNIYPDFLKTFYSSKITNEDVSYSVINNIIKKNIHYMEIIARYIPGLYMMNTKEIPPHFAPAWLIAKNQEKDPDSLHIILSTDQIYYQDPGLFKDTYIIRGRGRSSEMLDEVTVIGKWLKLDPDDLGPFFSPRMVSPVQSLMRNPQLETQAVNRLGAKTMVTKFNAAINEDKLKDRIYTNAESWVSALVESEIFKKSKNPNWEKEASNNFTLTAHSGIFSNSYLNNGLLRIWEISNTDINDITGIREMNEQYYRKFPIDLDFLFQGITWNTYFPDLKK